MGEHADELPGAALLGIADGRRDRVMLRFADRHAHQPPEAPPPPDEPPPPEKPPPNPPPEKPPPEKPPLDQPDDPQPLEYGTKIMRPLRRT